MTDAPRTLLQPQFVLVLGVSFAYFVGFGVTMPALPLYVVNELGRGEPTVGLVFGAYAVTATLLRPAVGRAGSLHGNRSLLLAGAAIAMGGLALHPLATSPGLLVAARLIVGAGHAAIMVGITTRALELAPSGRRGEASSYVMVAIQVGMGTGPIFGELVVASVSFTAGWLLAAFCTSTVLLGALAMPRIATRVSGSTGFALHPAGLRSGSLMGLPLIGFAGFLAFLPLYGPSVGLPRVGLLFLVASGSVALTRLLGARVPDRLGGYRTARISMGAVTAGFLLMALWATPVGLLVATATMAVGIGLVVPSLILTAIERVPETEHAQVMAALTIFIDVAAALGPTLIGLLAAGSSYGTAFGVLAAIAFVALVTMGRWLGPQLASQQP